MKIKTFLLFLTIQVLNLPQVQASDVTQNEVSAKIAAIIWLDALGYSKGEFSIKIQCENEICTMDVFPIELLTNKYIHSRGCPLKVCATLTYSPRSKTILETVHWR